MIKVNNKEILEISTETCTGGKSGVELKTFLCHIRFEQPAGTRNALVCPVSIKDSERNNTFYLEPAKSAICARRLRGQTSFLTFLRLSEPTVCQRVPLKGTEPADVTNVYANYNTGISFLYILCISERNKIIKRFLE